MTSYALADRRTQWFGSTFSSTTFKPNCACIHTTEGFGWPSYDGGAKAPNYTAKPDFANKKLLYRAHFEDEESSRALANTSGGVETNTANVIQIELIGTCDPANRLTWSGKRVNVDYIYWPEAPDWALRDFAKWVADMNKRHGIKIVGPASGWVAYPESYGPGGQRFTYDQWRAFYGFCGHQHVPENGHGDPGKFPWTTVANYAKAIVSPPTTEVPPVTTPLPVPTESTRAPDIPNPSAKQIWDWDGIPAWDAATNTNKYWSAASTLTWTFRKLFQISADVAAIRKKLGA